MRRLLILATTCALLPACAGPAPADNPSPTKSAGPAIWGTVSGTVNDTSGRPVEGALIVVSALDQPPPPVPEIAVRSGQGGAYEWRLQPGRYAVESQVGPRQSPAVIVSVTAGQRTTANLTQPD